jgi:hypothetical protein
MSRNPKRGRVVQAWDWIAPLLRKYILIERPTSELRELAQHYRRMADQCAAEAKRLSLREDRELMEEICQRWIKLAERAEAAIASA